MVRDPSQRLVGLLGDRRLLVPSANDDPGLRVQGAPHETSLFGENSGGADLFITSRRAGFPAAASRSSST